MEVFIYVNRKSGEVIVSSYNVDLESFYKYEFNFEQFKQIIIEGKALVHLYEMEEDNE